MFLLKTAFLTGVMLSFWYHNSKTHLFVFVHQAPLRIRAKTNKQSAVVQPSAYHNSVFPSSPFLHVTASAVFESWPYYFLKRCNARGYHTAGSGAGARSPAEAARGASTPSTTPFPGLLGSCCPRSQQHHLPGRHRASRLALRPSRRCVGLKDLLYVPMRP